jgi:maltose O-acetyltransferase
LLVKHIFKKVGKNVNVEKGARFGSGEGIEIGDNSGIGINAVIPSNTIIGRDVMMGPNVYVLTRNHKHDAIDVPMRVQGYTDNLPLIIEDDVWIGRDVLILPGKIIKKGSIVGAGCVLTKNFPAYSIVGGNPSKLIKTRTDTNETDSI